MTNGSLINGENVDKFTEYFDTFSISLDGVDEESCSKIRTLEITGKASDNRESLEIKRLYLEDDNGNEENYYKKCS